MKKVLCIVLVLAMVLAMMAGCGKDNTNTPNTPATNNPGTSTDTNTPATGDNTIMLGLTGPLTGPYAIYGLAAARGAEIAVEEINAGCTIPIPENLISHTWVLLMNAWNWWSWL